MPVIAPGAKVLVSGANSYIAIWTIRTLLEQGYFVRGTVRSLERNVFLVDMFKSYGDKFELVVVEDIVKGGAFDEAVKGVDAIIHAASPLHMDIEDPKGTPFLCCARISKLIGPTDFIEPAVNGSVGILESATKTALKRIVIIASTACIYRDSTEPLVLSENDWNDQAIQDVERLGKKAPFWTKYNASKTLAEKAAWSFYRQHQKDINWDLVVINPSYVFGPSLNPASSPSGINASLKLWYEAVVDPNGYLAHISEPSKSWVDVRDLAQTLVKSLVCPEAGGERIIITSGSAVWQDWLDTANALSLNTDKALPRGEPGEGKNGIHKTKYDTSKAQRLLKPVYRTMEETTRDTLADFEKRGW